MLWRRIVGVFKLDAATFEEIEADTSATSQAALVVIVVALLGAVGSLIGGAIGGNVSPVLLIATLLSVLIGWVIWSAVTYFVGTALFGGQSNMGAMLRVIGFAYAPQVLGIIPCIGGIAGLIWTIAAGFVAVRQGLDLNNTKALLTILVGGIAYFILVAIVTTVFGGAVLPLAGLADTF